MTPSKGHVISMKLAEYEYVPLFINSYWKIFYHSYDFYLQNYPNIYGILILLFEDGDCEMHPTPPVEMKSGNESRINVVSISQL